MKLLDLLTFSNNEGIIGLTFIIGVAMIIIGTLALGVPVVAFVYAIGTVKMGFFLTIVGAGLYLAIGPRDPRLAAIPIF